MNCQSRFDTGYRKLGAGALGWPRGMVWGGRWESGSGWGTHVHPWQMHVDVWQNQYNIIKQKNKIKNKNKKITKGHSTLLPIQLLQDGRNNGKTIEFQHDRPIAAIHLL